MKQTKKTSRRLTKKDVRKAIKYAAQHYEKAAPAKKTTRMVHRLRKQAERPVKENPPHFWINCRVREDHHLHQCAAYVLVHEKTGQVFIDATGSFYSHMQFQELALKGGYHPNGDMQRLYNQSPRFELHYELIGLDDRNGLNRMEAEELKQMWIAALWNYPGLINNCKLV